MNKNQKNLLKLLSEIDAICQNQNIVYYAAGGTVIGAVRHQGFIPWDDDIDIYMTRENWLKFKEYFSKNAPDGRVLECWEDNSGYHNLLARYMDVNTTAIYKYELFDDAHMGQLIDIFILDPMSSAPEETESYIRDVMLLSDVLCEYIFYSKRHSSYAEYEALMEEAETQGKDFVIQKLLKSLERYEEKDADCYMLRWGGMPHIFPKEMFQEPKRRPFENLEIPLPSRISDYLLQLYGLDWMYIPPRGEKLTHKSFTNIDVPYDSYKSVIQSRISPSVASRCIARKKDYCRNMADIRKNAEDAAALEGEFIRRRLQRRLAEKELTDDERNDLFSEYLSMQCRKDFIGSGTFEGFYKKWNPTFIDIGDENLFAALQILLRDEQLSKADKILLAREKQLSRPLSQDLKNLRDTLQDIRKASSLYEFGKYEDAEKIIDLALERNKNSALYKFKLILLGTHLSDEESGETYEKLLTELPLTEKNEGDFAKLKGDFYFHKKLWKEAFDSYACALTGTNNALFHLQIQHTVRNFQEELLTHMRRWHARKDGDKDEYRLALSAWLRLFPESSELLCLYIETYEFGLPELLRENIICRICADPTKIDDRVYNCIAAKMGWDMQNAKFEIFVRYDPQEAAHMDWLLDKHLDISIYQYGRFCALKGDYAKAYQCYFTLKDSRDEYVAIRLKNLFKADWKKYTTLANEKKIDLDFTYKYKHFTPKTYIALLKDYEILPADTDYDYTEKSLSSFIQKNKEAGIDLYPLQSSEEDEDNNSEKEDDER